MTDISTQEPKPKRTYDAARTKEIILDAAEEIFAEQGFSAARIDAIAKAAGYNKSLIYQYFQDKLGLYTEVIIRADQLGDKMMLDISGELLQDDSLTSDPAKFKQFLEKLIHGSLQFILEHPRYLKILSWEMAEEWKTWNQITYLPDDVTRFYELAKKAQINGLLRADLDAKVFPTILLTNVYSSIQSYSRFKPFLNESHSTASIAHYKDQVARFIIHGVMEPSLSN
ncbi:TetR/AcrR family transcriptional regulator [Paenibacillus oryzisoli]|uniref:HTH tetR-type domain-containing protein n=1 Tax=Paenibacillus oryzisoli TaxID=1850517 RepID=A0A198AAV8_9BACL|nr:TetR/AcrR family transcriptional regulator [Paenibacillus oryzisoli]OAS18240.1 hypothetical protein A8708_32450 [Paenibacillus oryzisoli]